MFLIYNDLKGGGTHLPQVPLPLTVVCVSSPNVAVSTVRSHSDEM